LGQVGKRGKPTREEREITFLWAGCKKGTKRKLTAKERVSMKVGGRSALGGSARVDNKK